MNYESVRTLLCSCRTQLNYVNEVYVPLCARHVLCSLVHRANKGSYGG